MLINRDLMALKNEDPEGLRERIFWAKEWMKKKYESSRSELISCVLEGCKYVHRDDQPPLYYRIVSYILRPRKEELE